MNMVRGNQTHVAAVQALDVATNPHAWSLAAWQSALKLPHTVLWVVENDVQVVLGFLLAQVFENESEIHLIAVDLEHRRRGLARCLIQKLKHSMAAFQSARLFLEVRESNEAACALYETEGFQVIARRVKYYGDEDALVMECVLC